MKKVKPKVVFIDSFNNIVQLNDGSLCEIECYTDKEGDPCLYEEAVNVSFLTDNGIDEYTLDDYDLELRDR